MRRATKADRQRFEKQIFITGCQIGQVQGVRFGSPIRSDFMNSDFTVRTNDLVVGVPPSVFEEANMKRFSVYSDTVNYPTKVIAKALMLEMFNGNDLLSHQFRVINCDYFPDSRKLVERFLTLHTSFAVLACLETWWRSRHKNITDFRLKATPTNWLNEVLEAIDTDWIRWNLEVEIEYLKDSRSRYNIIYNDILPTPSNQTQCVKIHLLSPQTVDERFSQVGNLPGLSCRKPASASAMVCNHIGTRIGWCHVQPGAKADCVKTELLCLACGCHIQFEGQCHGEDFEQSIADSAVLTIDVPSIGKADRPNSPSVN